MSDELIELPEGWKWVKLEDIASHISGIAFKSTDFTTEGIQVIRLGNVYKGELNLNRDPVFLPKEVADKNFVLKPGNIIVSQTGTRFKRDYGYFVAIPQNAPKLLLNQRLLAVSCHFLIDSQYVVLASKLKSYQDNFFTNETGGVNQGNVGVAGIMKGEIPLPPLNEQKRIVAEIEALRERSQKARSALSAIPELCNKFRQSILAAAFRGDLTADWREQNPDVEPASVLLERIKDDRYKDWELEQLAKASHRSTKLDSGKLRVKYELPTSPQEDRLFRELEECIPDSWAITSLDSVARLITGKTPSTSEADYWDGEIPFVTPTEIDPSGFILPSRRLVTQLGAKQAKTIPSNSTLIVCIGTVGKVGILSNPSVVNQQINALVSLKSVSYKFIYYWAQALKPWVVANAAATVNAAILNKSRLGMAPIPIPPYLEQLHIVSMIEAMLSEISSLTSNTTNAYEWLNSLDRSILAKAFRGELVEQDPNDEPASVLLDRIRVDREQQAQGKAKKLGKKAAGNKL